MVARQKKGYRVKGLSFSGGLIDWSQGKRKVSRIKV